MCMFRKRNKKKRLRKISTKKRYPTRVGETTEPGSVHVLLFDIGNRPFSSSDGLFCRVLGLAVAYFSHTFYVPRLFLRINRDKSGPLRASNPVFPTHFNAHPKCVYVLSVYVLGHDKHQRLLDSKTSTTIRFKIRFKVVSCIFSKYGHPEKRNWIFFFAKNISTVSFT